MRLLTPPSSRQGASPATRDLSPGDKLRTSRTSPLSRSDLVHWPKLTLRPPGSGPSVSLAKVDDANTPSVKVVRDFPGLVRSWPKPTCERSGGIRVLTHQRHWLCIAAMVLMPISAPIKALV